MIANTTTMIAHWKQASHWDLQEIVDSIKSNMHAYWTTFETLSGNSTTILSHSMGNKYTWIAKNGKPEQEGWHVLEYYPQFLIFLYGNVQHLHSCKSFISKLKRIGKIGYSIVLLHTHTHTHKCSQALQFLVDNKQIANDQNFVDMNISPVDITTKHTSQLSQYFHISFHEHTIIRLKT